MMKTMIMLMLVIRKETNWVRNCIQYRLGSTFFNLPFSLFQALNCFNYELWGLSNFGKSTSLNMNFLS